MKILLRAALFLALFIISIDVTSQTTIRVNAGLSLATMSTDSDSETDINYVIPVGITAEFGIGRYLGIETGLIRSPKGFKYSIFEESTGGTLEKKLRFNPIYMEIPLAAKFVYQTGDVSFFGKAGLYLGIGSGGTRNTIHYLNGTKAATEIGQISWGSIGTDNLRRFDYGLILGAGCGIRSLQFELFYEPGLPDASPNEVEWMYLKNKVFGLSIAYILLSY
jgi:hypothetical protein